MRYGQQVPINLSASLCFEQSYQGVEGDSASAAELFCLLSSLAGVPLKQSLAVTGSVNQKGEIQPVGGVNQKIEGFYNACKVKGLTGDQGVIIPAQNRKDLMLSEEIVTAVREKRFHIYAISTVEEGLALLTGMEIGELREDGTYPPDSFNGRVISALKRFNELLKGEEGEEGEGEEGGPAPKEDHDCC
ncbi:MAG TPA: hypothetical protein PKX19_03525 [Bacillota bacterium]|nr:hypothetical protein [Bacillota bacterium]